VRLTSTEIHRLIWHSSYQDRVSWILTQPSTHPFRDTGLEMCCPAIVSMAHVMSIKLIMIVRSFGVLLFQVSMDSSRWVKVLVCFGICPVSYRAKQKRGRGQF
jgi:hypothetical protein